MTAVLAAELTLPDACPVCPPGIPDVSLPLTLPAEAAGGTIAPYRCGSCGSSWRTWSDCWGWPVLRLFEPVTPEQELRARVMLAGAVRTARGEAA